MQEKNKIKQNREKEKGRKGERQRETETFPSVLVSFQFYSTTCAEGLKGYNV